MTPQPRRYFPSLASILIVVLINAFISTLVVYLLGLAVLWDFSWVANAGMVGRLVAAILWFIIFWW
jgi:hypothetical protein